MQVISPDGQTDKKCSFTQRRVQERFVHVYAGSLVGYGQYRPRPSRCYARGEHAWYGNTVLKNSGALDMVSRRGTDPRFSPCPRQFTGASGVYQLLWWAQRNGINHRPTTLITDEGSVNEKQETFIVPSVMLAS